MKELFQLTSLTEARALLSEAFAPRREEETVGLTEACGRTLSRDILAGEDVPGFSRSTKDGYAVRAADTSGASESLAGLLTVTGEVLMGEDTPLSLGSGQAVQIATGGMLPQGADGVLMLEYVEELSDREILVKRTVSPGENVILKGEDTQAGRLLARKGRTIRPQEAGLFASQGILDIPVYKPLRVGILSTGNEVVDPARTPAPGQVRDVNTVILRGMAEQSGAQVTGYGICPDDYDELKRRVLQALSENDLVLISGGSSVGTRDYCVGVLGEITGGPPLFHGIPVKPGKPALGAAKDGKVILGLPGHPVSAANVFSLLARPLLEEGSGLFASRSVIRGVLGRNVPSESGRQDHIQVSVLEEDGRIRVVPLLGLSGMVRLLTEGDGEIVVPRGVEGLSAGTEVDVTIY